MIEERHLKEFDRRAAMRYCQAFKTVAEIQPLLDFLEDYGYIFQQPAPAKVPTGRPPLPKYTVNPRLPEIYRPDVTKLSRIVSENS